MCDMCNKAKVLSKCKFVESYEANYYLLYIPVETCTVHGALCGLLDFGTTYA